MVQGSLGSDREALLQELDEVRLLHSKLKVEIRRVSRKVKWARESYTRVVSSAFCPMCLRPLDLAEKYEYSEKVAQEIQKLEELLKKDTFRLDETESKMAMLQADIDRIERGGRPTSGSHQTEKQSGESI